MSFEQQSGEEAGRPGRVDPGLLALAALTAIASWFAAYRGIPTGALALSAAATFCLGWGNRRATKKTWGGVLSLLVLCSVVTFLWAKDWGAL